MIEKINNYKLKKGMLMMILIIMINFKNKILYNRIDLCHKFNNNNKNCKSLMKDKKVRKKNKKIFNKKLKLT